MSDEHTSHATYDELATPAEMTADCKAMQTNMPILRLLGAVPVPAPAVQMGEAMVRLASKPVLVVSDAAAKVATRLNPFD
jgi:hypothetical protein